jgi:membrane-associated phospholipid phosphatase
MIQSVAVFAAPPDTSAQCAPGMGSVIVSDAHSFVHIAGRVLTSPVRWERDDWLTFGAVGGGIAASSLLDKEGRTLMQRNRSRFNTNLTNYTVQYGDGLNMLLVSAGGYAAGLVFHNEWLRETAMLAGSSILIAGTVSTLTKVLVGRARPYLEKGHGFFKPLTISDESYFSFPSGHSIVAFAVSGVLAERIQNVWASVALYSLAAGTAYARVYADDHWFSDVVAGAAISVAISRSVVRTYEGDEECRRDTGLRVLPGPGGITVSWFF